MTAAKEYVVRVPRGGLWTLGGYLTLDGGTVATFLDPFAAQVAARRVLPFSVTGHVVLRRVGDTGAALAPWWQNDGPTWFTRAGGDR